MKRFFIIIAALFIASVAANAQWKVDSWEQGDPVIKFHQILETENSVLIYASLEDERTRTGTLYIKRNKAYVKSNGLKYKILNSVNIPLYEDGDRKWAEVPEGHLELNFIMEFEKFPVENGFDVIADTEDDGRYSFNGHNLQVSRIEPEQVMDTQRFLDSNEPVIGGIYSNDGTKFRYQIRDGVMVTYHVGFMDDGWFSENVLFYVDIVNNSDHAITFDFSKVYAVTVKKKNDGTKKIEPLAKFDPDSYDQFIKDMDYQAALRNSGGGLLNEVDHLLFHEKIQTSANSWERLGWDALQALNKQAMESSAQEYLKTHPTNRPKALKSQTIKQGEAIHGFIATKKKKADSIFLYIPMDDFTFDCELRL